MINVNKRLFVLIIFLLAGDFGYAKTLPTAEDFKREYTAYNDLSEREQWSDSLVHAKKSYDIGGILFGEMHQKTGALAYNYGLNLLTLDKNKQAEKIFKETLSIYESVYGETSGELIPVLMDLGHSMAEPFKKTTQKKYYKRALKLSQLKYGEESLDYGQRSVDVGLALLYKARSTLGEKYLYKGYTILEKVSGGEGQAVSFAALNIGKYELTKNNFDEAIVYLHKALKASTASDELSSQVVLSAHGFLAEAYERLERQDLATEHCLTIGRMTPFTPTQEYKPIVTVSPDYPEAALRGGREGYVVIEHDIDESGFVKNPKVIELEGDKSFARAGLKAIQKFRYAPRFVSGKPVATKGVHYKLNFNAVDDKKLYQKLRLGVRATTIRFY